MIRESQIMHEAGNYWVLDNQQIRCPSYYMVLKAGSTHSVSDSAYAHTPDGLSIAIARCNYLNRTHPKTGAQ